MDHKNTVFSAKRIINVSGRLLQIDEPLVMGVINLTPDSFYEGSRTDRESIVDNASRLLTEGATLLDIGGQSTRPGATIIPEEDELARVIPAIEAVHQAFPEAIISVDTFRSRVAGEAVEAGASMINDVSAGEMEEGFLETVAALQVPYVLMHMQGTPATMQQDPTYDDVVDDILGFFIGKIATLRELGVKDIILDPGLGFGKTVAHNYEIVKKLDSFKVTGLPIMVGASRKSMVCRLLDVKPEEALNGTTAIHTLSLLNGASILRVHDVREAREAVRIVKYYNSVPQTNVEEITSNE